MELTEFLLSKGFKLTPVLDGEYHRFDRTKPLSGWFAGKRIIIDGRESTQAAFGDWASQKDKRYEYRSSEPRSPEEAASFAQAFAELEAKAKEAKLKLQGEKAELAARIFGGALDRGSTAYLQRKKLPHLFGARIDSKNGQDLIVPLRDIDGKLWSLQFIRPEKDEQGIDKNFLGGGRIKGCFHEVRGPITKAKVIYVAEGFATAASIALATGEATVCAFNAGNLLSVCRVLRGAYPAARLVLCGDDDRWTEGNPGRTAAEEAALAVEGQAKLPVFAPGTPGRPTDWNDLHVGTSLDAVRQQLLGQEPINPEVNVYANSDSESDSEDAEDDFTPPPAPESPSPENFSHTSSSFLNFTEISPLPVRYTKTGIPQAPNQQRIVDHMVDYLANHLVKQDRDLFHYTGTHWKIFTQADHDRLKVAIQRVCSGLADVKLIDATYKLLIYHLPSPPEGIDLFTPSPFHANFLNGTLHAVPGSGAGKKFSLLFRPHRREDYLVNVLPLEYDPLRQARNEEFEAMLGRVFHDDPDAADKVRALRQMYGACLMPLFPHLFMLWGEPGTGKSTVMRIAARLVDKANLCSVDPGAFSGFNMEGMAAKLVNIDTDIPFDAPMRDEVVKKIIDRAPFRIRRKGIKDIMAPLPAIHLFGGNDLPKALDGVSKAHDRRWTFLEFKAFVPKGEYSRDYWDVCFDTSPQGVLNFALEGLEDLLSHGGHFLNPESGKEKMRTWQLKSDVVGQFLEDIKEGDVKFDNNTQVFWGQDAQIPRPQAWDVFRAWHRDAHCQEARLGRNTFFEQLRRKKLGERASGGVRYVLGFGVRGADGAKY
jgi:phage/plasmid primase-like uncharacterized protein/phage/plasmid-associated DNA primase